MRNSHAGVSVGVAALLGAVLVGLSGCSSASSDRSTTPSTPPTIRAESPENPATPSSAPEPSSDPESAATPITIDVNGTVVTGALAPSAAAASLLARLPLDLRFEDFGGQEKIASLPAPLSLDGMPEGGSAEPGTIGYYAPDQGLVLYYDSVGYYPGIIPLGTFDDIAAVRDAGPFTGTVSAAQ